LRKACAELHFGKQAISVRDPYIPFELIISNEGNSIYKRNTQIHFPGTSLTHQESFFLPEDIHPHQKFKMLCKVEIKDEMRISNVPNNFTPIIKDSEGRTQILKNGIINMKSEAFAGSLMQLPNYNILMFGPARNGKSTTANNIKVSLSKSFTPIRRSGPYGDHIDKEFTKTDLSELDSVVGPIRVSIFDTFGLDNNTYNGRQLEMMLSGSMKLNSKMFEEVEIKPVQENKIDAVAVLVSIEQSNPINYLHELIKQKIVILSNLGYHPIIVLTHAQNEKEEDLKKAINRISDGFQVEKSSIIVTSCYDVEMEGSIPKKNFEVDIRALSLLERLILESESKRERDSLSEESELKEIIGIVCLVISGVALTFLIITLFICGAVYVSDELNWNKQNIKTLLKSVEDIKKDVERTKRECEKLNGIMEQFEKQMKLVSGIKQFSK